MNFACRVMGQLVVVWLIRSCPVPHRTCSIIISLGGGGGGVAGWPLSAQRIHRLKLITILQFLCMCLYKVD